MSKFLKFIPFQLVIFLILGILLGKFVEISSETLLWIILPLSISFIFSYFFAKSAKIILRLFSILTFLLMTLIGFFLINNSHSFNKPTHYSNSEIFNKEEPLFLELKVDKILKPTNNYLRYEGQIERLGKNVVTGKMLVNIYRDSLIEDFEVDERLLVKSSIRDIAMPKNPYGFNYKKYLQNKSIEHQLFLTREQFISLPNDESTLYGLSSKVRVYINNKLVEKGFSGDELAVINALLLGQRNTISSELMESYKGAGAIHILAVSGLHIGIILLLLTFVFKPLNFFKQGKIIISMLIIIFLWSFAILAGLSASVVRAVAMFTALTIGIYSKRPSSIYNNLIISMFVLLLVKPNYLFEVGFQLSYLAVFFIVWIQPKLERLLKFENVILHKIWQLLTLSIAAQIGVLPLSLFYFHQFPGLFFLSNLLIIPFLGIILILGIITIIFSIIGFLPEELGSFYFNVINYLNKIVSWISGQNEFQVHNISFSFILMVAVYICIISFFKWYEQQNFKRFYLVLISIILIQIVYIFEKYELQSSQSYIIFNKSQESLIGVRDGAELRVLSSDENVSQWDYPLKDYLVGTGVSNVNIETKINNFQKFKEHEILVIDDSTIYELEKFKPSIIVLRNSPKINFERVLHKLNPKLIVADGSNFKSYVDIWARTCRKNKTPFYSTSQKGVFELISEPSNSKIQV